MASESSANGDELARTATDAASATGGSGPAVVLDGLVGRYRLERELGSGAMGVVHAAFDPDLERRVALKVLRVAAPGTEAKDRLLREARAMARLTHPNVVTVHEVGTTNGRDFIAMELILGETLADWLRSARRRPADIIAAFLAAGRGLAAAHAAGIVHRDFKPHNALRSRDGRIVVTDFGLAREAQVGLPVQLDTTLPLSAQTVSMAGAPSSSLTGITVTGSLLGTPAYMAPEQWSGGAVTPATDQFAYCVALWEALAGERPYRGPTLDDLRKQAALGPGALDASKIPRRLRAILCRGLDPDPRRRWPDMDALLARIVRVERRGGVAIVVAAGALVGALVFGLALRGGHELAGYPACAAPALDPAAVWSSSAHAGAGKQTAAARLLDAEVGAWRAARAAACELDAVARAPRLLCLDGVLAWTDAVARATRALRDGAHVDAGELLIDPQICALARPPQLVTSTSPELRDAVTVWLERTATPVPITAAEAARLLVRTANDPCAQALAHVLSAEIQKTAAERSRHLDEAQQAAERCGDDRVVAEAALASAEFAIGNEWLGATTTAKLRLAEAAVQRVPQRDLTAEIDVLRARIARRAENLEGAIGRIAGAMDGFAARGRVRAEIRVGLAMIELRHVRGTPEDLAAIQPMLAAWRARAVAELGETDEIVRAIDTRAALCAFGRGELETAHAELERLVRPLPSTDHRRVAGTVVDARGQPVAGATVAAGWSLQGNSLAAAAAGFAGSDAPRKATTGPDGRFEIPDAVKDAIVIAQLGALRSQPAHGAEDMKLALAPTSRIEGRVDLAGEVSNNVMIVVSDPSMPETMRYALIAPVAHDGLFAIEGLPRRKVRVFAVIQGLHTRIMGGTNLTVRGPDVRGVELSLRATARVVHVLVRSTINATLANAEVVVLPGKVASTNALAMNQEFQGGSIRFARQIDEHAPRQIVGAARPGDLFATMTEVPDGAASACAFGLPGLWDEELARKVIKQLERVPVICVPIAGDADLVMIEVPPLPRLD